MTGTVTTAAPGDAIPPHGGTTAPLPCGDGVAFPSPAPCPTCGRCPTCGHQAPVAPAPPWPYPWWGTLPPPAMGLTAMGPGRGFEWRAPSVRLMNPPPNAGSGWTPAP